MFEGKSLLEKMAEMFFKLPKVKNTYTSGRVSLDFYDNEAIGYRIDQHTITKFYSLAKVKDGRTIDTRTAKKVEEKYTKDTLQLVYKENGLQLTQYFTFNEQTYFILTLGVKDLENEVTVSNWLAPMDFAYPDQHCDPLFLSLEQKMFLVPYDNDMWVHYESAPLRPGRTSYDVTAIYNEDNNNGIIIGALDYDTWKNAIKCSWHDARCYTAFSGVADEGTHDEVEHGYLDGDEVRSARFMLGWYDDIRDGFEQFGQLAMQDKFSFKWSSPNPFGWNSYSAGCMTLDQWRAAGKFIREEIPQYSDENGVTYINLDANFMLNKLKMKMIVNEFIKTVRRLVTIWHHC